MNNHQKYSLTLNSSEKEIIKKLQLSFFPIFDKFINTNKDWSFYLSPYTYQYLLQLLPKYFAKLKEKVDQQDTLEQWELKNMLVILGKALIPDSFSPTFQNSKDLAQHIKTNCTNSTIHIRELCVGAGVSTILTYLELKKVTSKKITFIGTDNALESIITSAFLLSIYDIPFIIIDTPITKTTYDFNGVVLQYMDVHNALVAERALNFSYDAIFSDHGISYFSQQLHEKVLNLVLQALHKQGAIYICSLEPKIKIKLNTFETIKEILISKGQSIRRLNNIRAQRNKLFNAGHLQKDMILFDFKECKNGESHVTKYYTDDAAKTYNMLNAFIFNKKYRNLKLFSTYLRVLSEITKASRELGNDVQSSIVYTESCLKNLKNVHSEIIPAIEEGRRPMRTIKITFN